MMIIGVLFILFAFIPFFCIMQAVKDKGHNIGFLFNCAFIIISDIACFRLVLCKNEIDAANALRVFLIMQAWLFSGLMWMIIFVIHKKKPYLYCIPTAIISILQTVIFVNTDSLLTVLPVVRKRYFGNIWWVVENLNIFKELPGFYSVQTYRILFLLTCLIILVTMWLCCKNSANAFRNRFYILMSVHAAFTLFEVLIWTKRLPPWYSAMLYNGLCIVCLYYTCYYSDRKLRNWSLRRFANDMSDGFLLYNEHGDLIEVNDLLKYAFPPLIIKSFEFKENLDEWISDTIMVENIEVIKYELDGKETYYKAKKTDLTDGDLYLGTIYILHDTTESIHKMRAMEQAKQELEKVARMKSDFLANMSHEIRTPMNAVIGMAEIALRDEKDPDIKDCLLQIQHSGKNLLNIINDILDFSKIESGKMEIIPDRYEPVVEITEIANLLAARMGDKENVELFVVVDNNMPHALEGDVMRIRQILINLANNAIKFTQQGFVSIVISLEKLSENTINVIFHVIDTGQGIKNEDLDKLFVSFQQVDSKRNRSVEGTGLGLAISQKLAEAMHGRIGVTSEYGKGSDFYFSIPQKVLDPALDIVVEDAENKHATVIDDHPELLGKFIEEINKLSVEGKAYNSLSEFEKSDGMDFVFFKEERFNDEFRKFLNDNPDVTGVILIEYNSSFTTDIQNLRIMRKPETSINMVNILNGKKFANTKDTEAFKIDYTAPDAKILIVDDNSINITIAEGLIKPLGSKCFGAVSGKDAIALVEQEDFDIILMDHMMPEMDGVETTRFIRDNIEKAKDIPIIALTANALEGVREMFLSEGMNDFVPKPVDVRNLITKLKVWIPKDKIIDKSPEEVDADTSYDTVDTDDNMISFAGLDCEKAIQGLGSAELFNTIVKEYYRSGKTKYEEIENAYNNEDWGDYTIKVHALKSSSRQIGAYELGDMAEKLEMAGKADDIKTIHEHTQKTLEEYDKLLNNLSPYFVEETVDEESLEKITADVLNGIIDKLSLACDELDMDEMEECKQQLQSYSYPEEFKKVLETIYDSIDNIDIDACIENMDTLKTMFV